ncbi:MAG: cysteine hydrolase [Alphaproteobacteria bacterium]|nr:cysteine hydrolase [Alphaproteobacteria bacterium]
MTRPLAAAGSALLLVDLQNDFLHDDGAYARGGARSAAAAVLPARLAPLCAAMRRKGGTIVSTHFTLVPGRDGEPLIAPHLRALRPFLRKGDFAPGSWGQDLVAELAPSDVRVEKVAYSAFFQSRLEWVLRKLGVTDLLVAGIVTNGGVESTVRDAHVRDLHCTVLSDGCAAGSAAVHNAAMASMASVVAVATCAEAAAMIEAMA